MGIIYTVSGSVNTYIVAEHINAGTFTPDRKLYKLRGSLENQKKRLCT